MEHRIRSVHPPAILMVEDDRETSTIYADYLESKGFRVLLTRDAAEGIRLAEEEQPALILMDLLLPRMSGCAAIRELKSRPATAHIPVLAMTASSLDVDRQEAREAGCNAFLEKPCVPQQLLRQVDTLLGDPFKGAG